MFLHDQRQRGLQSLGSDFVSQSANPAKRVVIPAINHVALSGRNTTQMLRILAPGSVNANVRAKLIASDGTFSPIELDDISIKSGRVKDIIFKPVLEAKNFSLVLTADQPIVAAVKSSGTFEGVNEFTWSTSRQQLQETTMYFGGLRPEVVFQGKNIARFIARPFWATKRMTSQLGHQRAALSAQDLAPRVKRSTGESFSKRNGD
jgi:hypothetical protein